MKQFLKRHSPKSHEIKEHKYLGWLSQHLHDPSLWNFNRRSISKAFAIGLFCAFIPIPFQMLLAAPVAVIFSANLPVSITLVWVSNPLTIPPIFYGCYQLGAWILGIEIRHDFVMSLNYIWDTLGVIWQPFLLGCLLLSITSSFTGYWMVQLIYRIKIYKKIKRG